MSGNPERTLRVVYRTLGGHVHASVYLASGPPERPGTFALCGELTFRDDEWGGVHAALRSVIAGDLHVETMGDAATT
jgi:hypothetical protein